MTDHETDDETAPEVHYCTECGRRCPPDSTELCDLCYRRELIRNHEAPGQSHA